MRSELDATDGLVVLESKAASLMRLVTWMLAFVSPEDVAVGLQGGGPIGDTIGSSETARGPTVCNVITLTENAYEGLACYVFKEVC